MELNFAAAAINVILMVLLTAPHEFAHAWTAARLGDDTPRIEGRVTLHPMAHIDWLGTVILPGVMSLLGAGLLGWGRPVNTNPYKLKYGINGMVMVALAGPFSNVLFALVLGLVAVAASSWMPALAEFAVRGIYLSLYLAIFNMMPVPPLDGSKLLLAARAPVFLYNELARFGFVLLIVVMSTTGLGRWMSAASFAGVRAILGLFGGAGTAY
ncbi:MAG TPA: site-2 protease family protein [Solibacterales bacterium]|nr:site-2 protease family protein [Bryobacterales bacterium]